MAETQTVPYDITEQARRYMYRAQELGAFEGEVGKQEPAPEVAALFDALHTVLAGGKVRIEVLDEGNPDVRSELRAQLQDAVRAANRVNAEAETYTTAIFP